MPSIKQGVGSRKIGLPCMLAGFSIWAHGGGVESTRSSMPCEHGMSTLFL